MCHEMNGILQRRRENVELLCHFVSYSISPCDDAENVPYLISTFEYRKLLAFSLSHFRSTVSTPLRSRMCTWPFGDQGQVVYSVSALQGQCDLYWKTSILSTTSDAASWEHVSNMNGCLHKALEVMDLSTCIMLSRSFTFKKQMFFLPAKTWWSPVQHKSG